MGQRGRIGAMAMLALALPGLAAAEDAFIRIEAKRGAAAEAAAADWRARFPDVVTVPLASGMTGIVLGPQTPAEAAARMARLKAEGAIPADSYLTGPGGEAPLSGVAAAAEAGPADAASPAQDAEGRGEVAAAEGPATPAPALTTPAPAAAPEAADTAPRHIQLQATPGRVSAEEALAEWRRSFPEAGLWRMPGGWFAVALPAQPAGEARDRMAALKADRRIPRDAFLATPQELGEAIAAEPAASAVAAEGQPAAPAQPDAEPAPAPSAQPAAEAAPPAPAVMPPIPEVQRALRWAGLYEGALDGQSGPATRAAIEARVKATGAAGPAEAMAALIAEREAWRREMGLEVLEDAATGLSLLASTSRLSFDRTERALSIYGPKDGSGAALILFAQDGGQQEMEDLAGLVTALGWVPHPARDVGRGRFTLTGANELHVGHAEGRVKDGRAEGWVLIWPAADAENARRLAIEAGESFARTASGGAAGGAESAKP